MPIFAGDQVLVIRNTGGNWFNLSAIQIEKYLPKLVVVGRRSSDGVVIAWIANRDAYPMVPEQSSAGLPAVPTSPISGRMTVPDLRAGIYQVRWWDTVEGKVVNELQREHPGGAFTLETPPVSTDIACWISPIPAK